MSNLDRAKIEHEKVTLSEIEKQPTNVVRTALNKGWAIFFGSSQIGLWCYQWGRGWAKYGGGGGGG